MVKIDKKFIVAAGALIAIMMFLLEPFQWASGSAKPAPVLPSGQNVTGTAVFNGTIRTYDPLLLLPLETSQSIIDQLRMREGVRDITKETNAWAIQTETRDDVFPLAQWLSGQNVTSYSIANVAVNQQIEVETMAGLVNATVAGGVVRVVTEPLLDADSTVTVSMVAILRNNQLIDYSSATLLIQPVELTLNATLDSLEGKAYTYSIPWAERNNVGDLSGYGSGAAYSKIDSVVFTTPLTVEQILIKKQFPYILYIDSGSAQVEPSFDNATLLQSNFADTPYTLPPSILTITTNETPELNFTSSVKYLYGLAIQGTQYDFGDTRMVVESYKPYDINSTIELNISALVLGDRVVSVKRVSLPS